MYEVTVKIGGNASKYWASLEFDDAKGKTHRKEIARERSATKSSNTLQALIDALGILRNPCVLTIYTEDDALAAAWSNGWVNTWQQHSWKNAKGNTIRNAEQWQQLYELMTPHGRRCVCQKAEWNQEGRASAGSAAIRGTWKCIIFFMESVPEKSQNTMV